MVKKVKNIKHVFMVKMAHPDFGTLGNCLFCLCLRPACVTVYSSTPHVHFGDVSSVKVRLVTDKIKENARSNHNVHPSSIV